MYNASQVAKFVNMQSVSSLHLRYLTIVIAAVINLFAILKLVVELHLQPVSTIVPSLLLRKSISKYARLHFNVRRLTDSVVVKTAPDYTIKPEVEALRFVREHTTIPVPRVYDVRTLPPPHPGTPPDMELYMEFMEGKTLLQSWRQMTPAQKESVARQLEGFVAQLRAIPQPAHLRGMVCSAAGGMNCDRLVWIDRGFGPFATLKDAHDWRLATFKAIGEEREANALRLKQLRQDMWDDEPIVFTHGDINFRNVLVRLPEDGGDEVEITALLDWEQAGWRPEHWESVKLRWQLPAQFEDWRNMAMARWVARYEKQHAVEIGLGDYRGVFGGDLVWPE